MGKLASDTLFWAIIWVALFLAFICSGTMLGILEFVFSICDAIQDFGTFMKG